MNIFELFGSVALEGMDKVEKELTGLEKKTEKVQKGLKVMGAAFTGLGVAGLAVIDKTKKINAQLGVTAINLGVTTKEMRDLTLATTNVTFPIDEVTKTFDLLARAGIEDVEVLKAMAENFDTLGDAIGLPASVIAAALIPSMKTFNLTADEMMGKQDDLTWLFRNSTIELASYRSMIGYVTPEIVSMGLTHEDLIAILADLEAQGYSGEVMMRKWRAGITEATKTGKPLNEVLGVSNERIAENRDQMEAQTGITRKYADVANEQFTIMDKLKQKWGELTLGASGFLEPLEPILAGMTAMGPLMIALSTSAGTATVKWVLHTAALVAHKIAAYASAVANRVLQASMGPVGWAMVAISIAAVALIPLILKLTGATKDASVEMDDYTTSLFQNKLATGLTTDEWVKAYEKGYLLEEQIKKIAAELGISTEELLTNMEAAGMLEVVMTSAVDTGRVYIGQLEEQTIGLDNVKQKIQELTSEQETLNRTWDNFMQQISPSVKAFNDYGLVTEDVINYLAQTEGSIDAVIESLKEQGIAANDVKYYLDELGISAEDVAESVGKKKRAIEEEKTADEEAAIAIDKMVDSLEYQTTAAGKAGLTIQDVVKALILEDMWNTQVRDSLVNLGGTTADVNEFLMELGLTTDQITAILEHHKDIVDSTKDSYEGLGKAAEETSSKLESATKRFEEFRGKAGEAGYEEAFLDQWTARHAPEIAERTGETPEEVYDRMRGYQRGGLITEPTLLTRLGEKRPYGIMAERGPEWITPGSPGSPGGVTINIYDPHVRDDSDIDEIAERIVARMRLRGVKL